VDSPLDSVRRNQRLIAHTAAAMYGGAAFLAFVENFIPGGPRVSLAPGLIALVVVAFLITVGPRLPPLALAPLGPIGVALIADALATTPGPGDGAVLYMWPVLWTAFFFGTRGTIAIVAFTGVAHAIVLVVLPPASGFGDRWFDVMVSVSVVALVVHVLAQRNDDLLRRVAAEARIDKLTGLLNRRGFDERAAIELAHAQRESRPIAVVSFDIDYFKRINDEWGHEIGDQVLTELGRILTAHARSIDVVARIGGEEFVVLLPDGDDEIADAFTQRIRRRLAEPTSSTLPTIRISAGVATQAAPLDVDVLLQRADSALYAAKRTGRDRTVVFELPDAPAPPALVG